MRRTRIENGEYTNYLHVPVSLTRVKKKLKGTIDGNIYFLFNPGGMNTQNHK